MEILNLSKILETGKKIAFANENRDVEKPNLKSKIKSLKECECNLVPLMYVSGTKAVEDGCELVTPDNQPIAKEEAANYIVIIDGQHRYQAFIEAGLDPSKLYLYESYATDIDTLTLLSEANQVSNPWKPKDYLRAALMKKKNDELLKACNELKDRGYGLPTISKIYTWSGVLSKKKLTGIVKGAEYKITSNLERGNKFIEVATAKFDEKFVTKRYLIDAVINLSSHGFEKVLEAMAKLSEEEVNKITSAKSDEISVTINEILSSHLATA